MKNQIALTLKEASKIIPNKSKIFTHCYSTSVITLLIAAKEEGKKFEVFTTEVRPKYLGRKAALKLAENKIKVSITTDLAGPALLQNCDLLLFGAEEIKKDGSIINKVGTNTLLKTAKEFKIPAYCVFKEGKRNKKRINTKDQLWKTAPKGITVLNPGHEEVYSSNSYTLLGLKA